MIDKKKVQAEIRGYVETLRESRGVDFANVVMHICAGISFMRMALSAEYVHEFQRQDISQVGAGFVARTSAMLAQANGYDAKELQTHIDALLTLGEGVSPVVH